jgi:hypothetical protein
MCWRSWSTCHLRGDYPHVSAAVDQCWRASRKGDVREKKGGSVQDDSLSEKLGWIGEPQDRTLLKPKRSIDCTMMLKYFLPGRLQTSHLLKEEMAMYV